MKHITTILFDYGNVLFDIDIPGAIARMEALMNPAMDADAVRQQTSALVIKLETGAITVDEFVTGLQSMARPHVTAADVVTAWNSMLVGMPPYRLLMLTALREKYDLYLLSNINVLHLDCVNEHLKTVHGITDFESEYLHDAFYSHLIGKRKPDHEAFQHVIDHTELTPQTTLFIDDTEANLRAAEAMGFHVHHSPVESEVAEFLREIEFY